jgi:hypothetical protein
MSADLLANVEAHLNAGIMAHPAYCLLLTTCVLDPFEVIDYDDDDEDDFAWAWKLMMDEFPEIYAKAITTVYQPGAADDAAYKVMQRGLADIGIEMDGYESLHWVAMMPEGMGVGWEADDAEVEAQLDRVGVKEILWLFRCKYSKTKVDITSSASQIARAFFNEYIQHEDVRWHDLACAVGWVFSVTNNTAIDYTHGEIMEWGADYDSSRAAIEFVGQINIEASHFWRAAQDGFKYFHAHINDLADPYISVLRARIGETEGRKKRVRKSTASAAGDSIGFITGAVAAA